ncbi:MAG: hypothetical protein JSU69_01405, partial [Candidatus Zixiibacteriota bacterium]
MSKSLLSPVILAIVIVILSTDGALAAGSKINPWHYRKYIEKNTIQKLAGAERVPSGADATATPMAAEFSEKVSQSPGMTIGWSTYDVQSISRMNCQVGWRGSQMVHFTWTKSKTDYAATRVTGYEAWDPDDAELLFCGIGGGCDLHADAARSGYVSLDVDTESKAVIANHHDVSGNGDAYMTTVSYDNISASCFFGPYMRIIPDSTAQYGCSPGDIASGDWRFLWPQHEYQVLDDDTVTHVFARQCLDVNETNSTE